MQTTILLVEDDQTTSRLETEILEKKGYHVIQAFTGEEAVEIAGGTHDRISLILMDIDLGPGMDGAEAARHILSRHDIPVMFLSSHTEKETVEKTEIITNYGYVVKGSGSIVLAASIKMALKLHRANRDVIQKNREIQSINNSLNSTIEGYIEDISERKQLEKKLKESESLFRDLTEKSIVGVYLIQDRVFRYINPTFAGIFGYPIGEIADKIGPRDLTIPEDWHIVEEKLKKRESGEIKSINYTFRAMSKTGALIHAEVFGTRTTYNGKPAIIGTLVDITKRKCDEDRIVRSFKEKEVLLAEIHHRVKNNMQIVTSLLSLQSDIIEDAAARDSFRECISRIQSMALVHEKLYQSGDMASINFREFITDLADKIFLSSSCDKNRIRRTISAEDSVIGIDIAIPCGLMITELVMNSLKHAFPGGRNGEIHIGLKKEKSGHFVLTVGDNGVGIGTSERPEQNSTLGFSLLDALVRQVKGEMEISEKKGTRVRITFPSLLPQGKFPPRLMGGVNRDSVDQN